MMKTLVLTAFLVGLVSAVPAIQVEQHTIIPNIEEKINPHDIPNIHENNDPTNINNNDEQTHKEEIKNVKKHIDHSLWCPICEYLVREGEDFITKNTTEQQATAFLDNACHHLPKEKEEQCEDFIKNNYQKLIELIIAKESAPIICSQLHVCKEINANQIDDCQFCKYASHKIENFMHSNRTLLDIIEYGETFCDKIGHPYDSHCNNVVSIYYTEIIGKLIDRNSFVDVCNSMHFCHNEHIEYDINTDHHDEHDPEHHDEHDPEHHDEHDPEHHDEHDPEHHDEHDPEHHDYLDHIEI